MPSVVQNCDCKHEYQDARYGVGRRVHNLKGAAKNPEKGTECTVCGKMKLKGESKK